MRGDLANKRYGSNSYFNYGLSVQSEVVVIPVATDVSPSQVGGVPAFANGMPLAQEALGCMEPSGYHSMGKAQSPVL